MLEKVVILILFFALTVGIGVYCRKHAASVGDFVLGGRNVGAWVTAFAYGTSYFSAVVFIGYAGQFGWSFGVSATWIGIAAGLGAARAAHADHDQALRIGHHARLLRQALRVLGA